MTANDAPRLKNHWWSRPGWHPGRIMYTWHITFEHATELHEHVRAYQAALTLPDLQLIPPRWLHLTVQGLGYTDEVGADLLDRSGIAVAEALQRVPPFDLSFGRPDIRGEAIAMAPRPAEPLQEVWRTIRQAIAEVTGEGAVHTGPEQANGFRPHVSVAYSSADHDAEPYAQALDSVRQPVTTTHVNAVSLIRQERLLAPHWLYRWTTAAVAPLND
ncbi:hypothetical protein GCM10023321_43840 [Pseudonocardia eucalypti]|uniref:2'-5' RNA ligase n=1 Tax=Pseudonocardia eucalypti TaxID=648755 RepID=A0ABP9QES9_9PSEU|nr:2'-5' RNA ligase [Pseudonocardia eucalypti]